MDAIFIFDEVVLYNKHFREIESSLKVVLISCNL